MLCVPGEFGCRTKFIRGVTRVQSFLIDLARILEQGLFIDVNLDASIIDAIFEIWDDRALILINYFWGVFINLYFLRDHFSPGIGRPQLFAKRSLGSQRIVRDSSGLLLERRAQTVSQRFFKIFEIERRKVSIYFILVFVLILQGVI